MTRSDKLGLVVLVAAGLGSTVAVAGNVGTLTTFVTGTPIRASEVNANFAAVKTAIDATATDVTTHTAAIISLSSRLVALEWNPPRAGSVSVGALDFQPTLTNSFYSVQRTYDDVTVTVEGGKLGATIRPYPGSTPTFFGCTYSGLGVLGSNSRISATLWAAKTGSGAFATQNMASFDMPSSGGAFVTTGTSVFGAPLTFDTMVTVGSAIEDRRYFIELAFLGPDSVNTKVEQCFVEYTATQAAP